MSDSQKIWVAIDDTDNEVSIGTGRLSRDLALAIEKAKLGICRGVTRHQLLIDPRIPYTSHNSSACIELDGDLRLIEKIIALSADFLEENFHEGADPGLCVAPDAANVAIEDFGRLAQKDVVTAEAAYEIAKRENIHLSEHGGTGLGVIGALAAVGLRLTGNDGRYIELPGIRNIRGTVTASEILSGTAIRKILSNSGGVIGSSEKIDTCGWVRPNVVDGSPTLVVEPGGDGCWRTIDPKLRKREE